VLQWIGKFDYDALDFTTAGEVFYFPRDVHCDVSVAICGGLAA
jgi:hypothetical protein